MNMINGFNPIASLSFGAKNRGWRRLCLLFLLLLVSALPLKAAPVSEDSARTVAAHVLGVPPEQLVNRTAETPLPSVIYLFVPESGVGFALISADDCALPVLGYSTTSVFELSYMRERYVSIWYRHYAYQISAIRDGNIAASPEVATQWEQWMNGTPVGAGTAIAPMLTTRWDIAPDYQQLNPVNSEGVQCKVPAAGVSMGQVMKYWNHPERGTGRMSYTSNGYQLTAEFDTAYPWSDMPDALDAGSTDAQRDAVNLLLYHVGVAMRTSYGTGSSSPSSAYSSTRGALTSFFRYSPLTISTLMMTPNNESTWKARVMQDLNSSRPVIYILQTNFSFVVDGCDAGGRLHFNFGLGGKNDGYFTVGSINPGNFTYAGSGQYIVSGIRPCDVYTISVEANNDEWGSVSGSGTYWEGERLVLTATPVFGSRFRQWSDGSTTNPRTVVARSSQTYTAMFEYIGTADIQAVPNNAAWGSVSGSGVYEVGDNVVLTATHTFGSRFRQWSDGNTDNPRTVTAVSDQTYTAVFEYIGVADIRAASSNTAMGSASGGGVVEVGDNVELRATPVSGWVFDHWDDGNNDNPRTVVATENRTYTAYFARPGAGDPQFHLVELDDRENHSWSYYSDPECLVRSLNPMDVRIRYFGYGENTMYSSDALQPEGEPDVDVSPYMVGIGIDAPWKNTYVYHKTLERVNGEQAESMAAADGPSFYRLIPNPYSRRPTHGTGDTRWRGFYKWRLKSVNGGSVYKDTAMTQPVSVGTMLDAEDTVFFMPAAEYGMEVDFEAIWAAAAVYYSIPEFDRATTNYVAGRNAYERNIVVWSCHGCRWQRPNDNIIVKDFTLTAVHPDGTDGESPHLLTDVPYHDNAGGDMLRHNLYSIPNSLTAYPPKFNRNTVGTAVGQANNNTLFWDREAIKFEYIRFSPSITSQYNVFALRSKAIPDTDTTWKMPFSSSNVNLMEIVGDTLRGFKVYNKDTLHAKFYDYGSVFSGCIRAGQIICGRMCLPQDGHNFFGMGTYAALMNNFSPNIYGDDLPKDIRYRLESGRFPHEILFVNRTGTIPVKGRISLEVVIGSDYDRSLGDNSKLRLYSFKAGSGLYVKDSINKGTTMFSYVIKSGTFTAQYDGSRLSADPYTAYIGGYGTNGYKGGRVLVVEGGEIKSIAGGMDPSVMTIDTNFTQIRMYIKGGHVEHAVWGAANYAEGVGARRMIFTGGEVNGWIAGGCNGTTTTHGATYGNSYIYFGGNARLQHDTVNDAPYYYSDCGNLYGAGSGHRNATGEDAKVGRVYNSHVVVADSAYISRNVYGGGNYGYVMRDSSHIQILGGTVKGKVFGGANQQKGMGVSITMRDGVVEGGIYGGSNILGEVKGPVVIRVEGGTVGTPGCADSLGNVFGCGYGVGTSVTGDVDVFIGRKDTQMPHVDNPVIQNNVYCGGFLGAYNATDKIFKITTYNGRILKSVYGGGFGSTATITGNTNVNIMGTTYVGGNVYGGGNMGTVTGDTRVIIGEDTTACTVTVVSGNDAMGSVSGGGVYLKNTGVRIKATPAVGHRFKQWDDGNTQNPRSIIVLGDATYTAEFEAIPVYTITVVVADGQETMGTVSGGGDYMEGQAVSIRATPNTGYRFKQWSDGDTQNPRSFNAAQNVSYTAEFEEIPVVWVDLELPSGLQWAASNLGADTPEGYGRYFAWGEINMKTSFTAQSYKYWYAANNQLIKYCNDPAFGYGGFTDNLTTLQPEDDAATAILGGGARIPTNAEWQELINNTTQANATVNGVAGRRFTSKKNGNSIFFPFAGYTSGSSVMQASSCSNLWTSTLGTSYANLAVDIFINNSSCTIKNDARSYGYSIRAVRGGN